MAKPAFRRKWRYVSRKPSAAHLTHGSGCRPLTIWRKRSNKQNRFGWSVTCLNQRNKVCSREGAAMEVQLTSDQKAFARRAVESGRLHSEEEAVQEALALWEERERSRVAFLATFDDSRASLQRGEGRVITQESMRE